MKKLLLAVIMLFCSGQMWGVPFSFAKSCLKGEFYSYDPNANPNTLGSIQISREYTPVRKYGPGTPEYEQYKNCMQENGEKPVAAIYGINNIYDQYMG